MLSSDVWDGIDVFWVSWESEERYGEAKNAVIKFQPSIVFHEIWYFREFSITSTTGFCVSVGIMGDILIFINSLQERGNMQLMPLYVGR